MEHALDQEKAPLVDALTRHTGSGYTAFHVPGHKGWRKARSSLSDLLGTQVARADLSEVGDLDDLQFPSGAIEEAQMLAADAFGGDEALFLVNGVTSGIHAAILSCAHGGGVIVPRNVHRSVIGALALAGARPTYVMPELDGPTGIAGGVSATALERALDETPGARAVLLVHPTYYGVAGDIRRLVRLTHQRGVPVILDEAHGAHFAFHPGFPPSGADCGADISVVGCHKTAGAFTQGAMMIARGSRVDRDSLKVCLRTVQTTSPSYLLMASLDASRRLMATRGRGLLGEAISVSENARRAINDVGTFRCPGIEWTGKHGFFHLDGTKLTVVAARGDDCRSIETSLRDRFGIMVEFSSPGHLLAVVTYADDETTVGRLTAALETLAREKRHSGGAIGARGGGCAYGGGYAGGAGSEVRPAAPLHIPREAIPPREAMFAPAEWREIERARGAVCADVVAVYPPGIPALCPGETVDGESIDLVRRWFLGGLHVHGVRATGDRVEIRVLRDRRWEAKQLGRE